MISVPDGTPTDHLDFMGKDINLDLKTMDLNHHWDTFIQPQCLP